MIKPIEKENLGECAELIRAGFNGIWKTACNSVVRLAIVDTKARTLYNICSAGKENCQ